MKKQIILITGATAGIGRRAALELAARGHHVIATGRREPALAALRAEAKDLGFAIDTVPLDVTDAASIDAARALVDGLTGGRGIDVLVNNAGYGLGAPLVEASDADLRAQFETNVFGLMAVTRAFTPAMIERGAGRIINVSSVGGRITFPLMGAYHASKYAVEALSDALRNELAPFGVRVVVIEPGPIQTEFMDRLNETANAYRNGESRYREVIERSEAVERRTMAIAVGPKPVARAIARAVEARSPRARYVTPFSSWLGLALLRALPTPLADRLMRLVFGLNRKMVAAQPPLERALAAE